MFLWGLDLSLACTGLTVFEMAQNQPVLISSISTKAKFSTGKRLRTIAEWLEEVAQKYPPKQLVIERTFNRFPTATAVLYKVHGVVNYLYSDVEQEYYSPKEIKKIISNGSASKELVQKKIKMYYPDVKFENTDESDSFAIALTWLIKNGLVTLK